VCSATRAKCTMPPGDRLLSGSKRVGVSACCEVTASWGFGGGGVDLGGFPLLLDDAGGSILVHPLGDLLGPKLPASNKNTIGMHEGRVTAREETAADGSILLSACHVFRSRMGVSSGAW